MTVAWKRPSRLDELGLFTAALGLSEPWRVTRTEFDPERPQLDLYLDLSLIHISEPTRPY